MSISNGIAASGFGRVQHSGYTDMGRIRIPPLPKWIGLTDRSTGVVWYLSHNIASPGLDGLGYISINDQQPRPDRDWVIFGPYDGPELAGDATHPNIRLLVRGGYLGYEIFDDGASRDNGGQLLTRRGLFKETREINRPVNWVPTHTVLITGNSDELGWTTRVIK